MNSAVEVAHSSASRGQERSARFQFRILPAMVAVAFATVVAAWVLGPNVEAVFGPIDDHEPLAWMGSGSRVPLTEAWQALLTSEVGQAGSTARFRPVYYVTRVMQGVVLGDNPRLWYACTVALFIITVSALGYAVARWTTRGLPISSVGRRLAVEICASVLGVLLFASMPAWAGIATRLGPSEQLALAFAALSILGATKLADRAGTSGWWWLVVSGGAFGAALSKENFVPILLLPLATAGYRVWGLRRPKVELLFGAVPLGALMLLAWALLPGLLDGAADVYGRSIGEARVSGALSALIETYRWYWAPAALVFLVAWIAAFTRRERGFPALGIYTAVLFIGSLLWLCFDAIVYAGDYTLPRYWAVFQFVKVLLQAGALALALFALGDTSRFRRIVGLAATILASVLLASSLTSAPQALADLRAEALTNAAATQRYQDGIRSLLTEMDAREESPVVVVAAQAVDFEPVVAVSTAIQRHRPGAAASIRSLESPVDGNETALQALARLGSATWRLLPASELPDTGSAICAFINRDPDPQLECAAAVRIDARAM